MTPITDFIAELIRAANKVEKLGVPQRKRLLQRAIGTIYALRDKVGMVSDKNSADATARLKVVAGTIDRRTNEEVGAALLVAADIIRTLKIVLDAKDEVLRGE
ncbi:flagellin-specific chaperone FliS [Pararhizobium capsulatum DSM 1112]|uniref:Flagellin-specific chaperone FliS n=1 Tax=Pararhizobium capsulatum DSM 1112 TaxID=1121113 RepID=A0ABU0C0U7_9HYPH|nr:hypothetical protein [Pararhizobium capsulatum]MDQ0324151.1 flagellin-specific chaperone FliS [Pararhizobium capsulatum DSM 1112]